MEKEKLQYLKSILQLKYKGHMRLISDAFVNSLQIILDNNAKITVEEFWNILNNSENKVVLKDDSYNIEINFNFDEKEIKIDNKCKISAVTAVTGEPMHIVCDIPEHFNDEWCDKNEVSTFIMPNGLKNASMQEKILNTNAVSSIARALGVDLKTITQKQLKLLFKCLKGDLSGGITLGDKTFEINFGIIETDYCDIAYMPEEGLVIDYDDGKVRTYKSYGIDENGDIVYKKQEVNFYNYTQEQAINRRLELTQEDTRDYERLEKLKNLVENGIVD